MDHLYEDKAGTKHACEKAEVHPGVTLVWTKCHIDVPAGKSFRSFRELPNCPKCKDTTQ